MKSRLFTTAHTLCAVIATLTFSSVLAMADSVLDTGTVDGNAQHSFALKADVYMNTCGIAAGAWNYQITSPSGSLVLKSNTPFTTDVNGNIVGGTGVGTCGGTSLQLAPFNTTDNASCVYKLWISQDSSFPHNNSRTKTFRTCDGILGDPNPTSILSGLKFYDANHDGVLGATEVGIQGVKITITYTGAGGGSTSMFTAADGTWTAVIPSGGYTVCEDKTVAPLNTLWVETTPTANGGCFVGTAVDLQEIDDLNFGNVATVTGTKYYDFNLNGNPDGGTEATLNGVTVVICTDAGCTFPQVTTSTITSGGGKYFFYLPTATSNFQICEVVPGTTTANSFWSQTGPLNGASPLNNVGAGTALGNTVKCWAGSGTVSGMYLTNVCFTRPSGGLSHGYWEKHQTTVKASDFAALTAFHLRNANGTDRDFLGTLAQNQADLVSWMGSVDATNMSYMLSVQMASAKLSTTHGLSDATLVDATAYGLGVISIAQLFINADALLAADGNAITGDSNRSIQEKYKNVFDDIVNNRLNFVNQPGVCTVI